MWLQHLDIQGIRSITQATLNPCNGYNLITGANGSGKSSILEAIHCLSTGKSFRTQRKQPLIQNDLDIATVYAEVAHDHAVHRAGLQKRRDGSSLIRLDGRNLDNQVELATLLPVIGITPESDDLLSDGSKVRQAYLDWTLFHVEPLFTSTWRNYRRTLQQRNSALKGRADERQISSWDAELVRYGTEVDALRKQTLARLLPLISKALDQLMPSLVVNFSFRQGWPRDETLSESCRKSLAIDRKMGFTHTGPHRADIQIKTSEGPVTQIFSRGQKKLLSFVLKLAQVWDYSARTGRKPIVYIDDLPAELDIENQANILRALQETNHQLFITATSTHDVLTTVYSPNKVFHVEQGRVRSVV